jgi:hypothetical protein
LLPPPQRGRPPFLSSISLLIVVHHFGTAT